MKLLAGPGLDRFTAICRAVRAGGRKLAMAELSAAADLAIELNKPDPDMSRVGQLQRKLGLDSLEGIG